MAVSPGSLRQILIAKGDSLLQYKVSRMEYDSVNLCSFALFRKLTLSLGRQFRSERSRRGEHKWTNLFQLIKCLDVSMNGLGTTAMDEVLTSSAFSCLNLSGWISNDFLRKCRLMSASVAVYVISRTSYGLRT